MAAEVGQRYIWRGATNVNWIEGETYEITEVLMRDVIMTARGQDRTTPAIDPTSPEARPDRRGATWWWEPVPVVDNTRYMIFAKSPGVDEALLHSSTRRTYEEAERACHLNSARPTYLNWDFYIVPIRSVAAFRNGEQINT